MIDIGNITTRPGTGRVIAVHNSPGSPYAATNPMSYDIVVDFGPPTGVIVYERVIPDNKYPTRYDVYGAEPRTTVLISWDANRASFTIPWAEDVTTTCEDIP